MSLYGQEPNRTARVGLLPWTFVALGLGSLGLGFVGFYLELPDHREHPFDLFYYTMQLFVLGSAPLDNGGGGPYPWPLEIARFGAPAVTVYAIVEAIRQLFRNELHRVKARRARVHTIVCGDGLVARTIARRLVEAGRQVVTISRAPLGSLSPRDHGTLRVVGDARDPDVLRAAGIDRAVALYAGTADSAVNTAIALAATRTPISNLRPELAVYARVADPDLCLALQARYIGQSRTPGVRLDFFCVDDLAARRLLRDDPPRPVDGRAPRVMVLGATAFGRAVLVEVARCWRLRDPAGATRLPLTLVDDDARQAAREVAYRYPFLHDVCELIPHEDGLPGPEQPPDRVYVCYDDEERALRTALTAERLWHGGPRSVVVRLDRLAALGTAYGDGDVGDEVSAALHLYGASLAASDPELIGDDLVERLARVIHEGYLLARLRSGSTINGGNPAMVSWGELPESFRAANRAQAADVGRKLRSIHCVLSPRVGPGDGYLPDADEMESMAVLEHERWCAQHRADSRLSGGRRGDWRRRERPGCDQVTHPALVDWSDLPVDMRELNRAAMRQLPEVLADAGFRVVRLPPRGEFDQFTYDGPLPNPREARVP